MLLEPQVGQLHQGGTQDREAPSNDQRQTGHTEQVYPDILDDLNSEHPEEKQRQQATQQDVLSLRSCPQGAPMRGHSGSRDTGQHEQPDQGVEPDGNQVRCHDHWGTVTSGARESDRMIRDPAGLALLHGEDSGVSSHWDLH